MNKLTWFEAALLAILALAGCSGRGGTSGPLATAGPTSPSLVQGQTAPYHSKIAQSEVFQKVVGLNFSVYPAPVDEKAFDSYGIRHDELDATAFIQFVQDGFAKQQVEELTFTPSIETLEKHPFATEVAKLFDGKPIQIGLVYGRNSSIDFLEYTKTKKVLIPLYDMIVLLGARDKINVENWTYDIKQAKGFFVPANSVIELSENTMSSPPLMVHTATGEMTIVVLPKGTGQPMTETPSKVGEDKALVAQNHWVFALSGVKANEEAGYYTGLLGKNISIMPAD